MLRDVPAKFLAAAARTSLGSQIHCSKSVSEMDADTGILTTKRSNYILMRSQASITPKDT